MLKKFFIDNFKSLVDFEVELSHFNCLIGLNGAGKSTLLQAIDFASSLMVGDVENWLSKRGWESKDLNSALVNRRNITLGFEVQIDNEEYRWEAVFNRDIDKLRCTQEKVSKLGDKAVLFSLENGIYRTANSSAEVDFTYKGSVFSRLKSERLSPELVKVKERIASLRSMDLLSPQLLHKKAKRAEKGDIGMGGEHLSAFIHELSKVQQHQLQEQLQNFYPQICSLTTKALRAGWIQLEITEQHGNGNNKSLPIVTKSGHIFSKEPLMMVTEARHINDGMLRLLAILAQQFSPLETLLFDEIENGINPEITEKVVDALVGSTKQIIVTTHSPMVLNYMEDDVARQSVTLLYKRLDGRTQACRFFEIPSAAEKLNCLAAGDAMLDLSLKDIAIEAEQIRSASNV
jgi:predicted ATPase